MILLHCRKCGAPATAGVYLNKSLIVVSCWNCADDSVERVLLKAQKSEQNFNVIQVKGFDDK